MKYLRVDAETGNSYLAPLDSAIEELRMFWEEQDVGDKIHFELVEMDEKEYKKLPEFEGF